MIGPSHALAHIRDQVQLSLFTDFENVSTFKPQDMQVDALHTMLKDVLPRADPFRSGPFLPCSQPFPAVLIQINIPLFIKLRLYTRS